MLEVSGLTKRYGDILAVDDIGFRLEKGEVAAFLGPNGAGKTTTLRIVTGYLPPTAGAVLIGGVDLRREPTKTKRMVGYLPEVPPLYPEMRVEGYLRFVGKLKGLRKQELEKAIEEAIDRCRLKDVRKRFVYALSKGYRQRLGLAQAILGNPGLLILDEPTAGLDPAQIVDMRSFILELKGSHTILLSTHILSEAAQICNRVLIIHKGKLVGDGTLEQFATGRSLEETYMSLVAYS